MFGHYPCIPNIGAVPFGALTMSPRTGFLMGMACATAFPAVRPMTYPPISFGYSAVSSLVFGSLSIGCCWRNPILEMIRYNPYAMGLMTLPSSNNFSPLKFSMSNLAIGGIPSIQIPDFAALASQVSYTPTLPIMPTFNFNTNPSTNTNPSQDTETAYNNPTEEDNSPIDYSQISKRGIKLAKNNPKYGKAFLNKVKQIARNLNCDYRDLLAIMYSESGIDASLRKGNYAGLIMFHKDTAKGLGTSLSALAAMSPIQQLDYVEKCFKNAKKQAGIPDSQKLSAGQLYSLIFLPARANREVLCSNSETGNTWYKDNIALDDNGDGKITRSEMAQRIAKKYVSDESFVA